MADLPAVEQRLFKIEQQIVNLHNLSKPQPVNLEPMNKKFAELKEAVNNKNEIT